MQPGQQKITQFDEVTSTQSGDIIPIVRGGQNKKISVENFTGVLPEGWLTPAEAWTFASFGNGVGVITIPEGNINRYPNGTRVWFKQGTPTATNRYGVVIGSTTTTLTVAMIAGTTLQNLAIQQPAVSSEVAPRTSENVDFTIQTTQPLSTNETDTGRINYDGRKIYSRTFTGSITASGGVLTNTPLGTVTPAIHRLVSQYGHFFIGTANIANALPAADPYGRSGSVSANGNDLRLVTISDLTRSSQPYAVTVEYTKA